MHLIGAPSLAEVYYPLVQCWRWGCLFQLLQSVPLNPLQIAKRTSVIIIAPTGFYRRSKVPKWMADIDDERQMEERMLKEGTDGIFGTKLRAEVIKIAEEGSTIPEITK